MKMVISNARALIQLCLPHSPVLIATHAEEILRGVALGHLRQDGECSRRQRKFMQAGVLGARWGKHDHLPGEVDLVPLQCADLLPALACQEQEAEDIAEGAIVEGAPQLAQFVLRQHPFPARALSCLASPLDWIGFDQSLLYAPVEQGREGTARAVP